MTPAGRLIVTVTGALGVALHPAASPLGALFPMSLYVIVVEPPAVIVVIPAVVAASF